jgi:uncharacterized protein YcbX
MTISLQSVHIYPVKALGEISLTESFVTPRGLQYDRRFMLVDTHDKCLTQRDHPKMATVWVEINGGEVTFSAPDVESISFPATPGLLSMRKVQVWNSIVDAHAVNDQVDQWLSDYLGSAVRLVYMPDSAARRIDSNYAMNNEVVSFADGYPLLISSIESLNDLNARIVEGGGTAVPMNRFRANLVISGCAAYAEDQLGEIVIGDAVFRAVKPCARCQVTTTDQAAGLVMGPEPLKTLATYRDSPGGVLFGMNLIPIRLGKVRVGDVVTLAQ